MLCTVAHGPLNTLESPPTRYTIVSGISALGLMKLGGVGLDGTVNAVSS